MAYPLVITTELRWLWRLAIYMVIIIVFPLLGAWLTGKPLSPYLVFPPRPVQIQPYPFSWVVFLLLTVFLFVCLYPFLSKIICSNKQSIQKIEKSPFPFWGWLGVALMVLSWLLAWNRFEWFKPVQEFTFTPLWLSYILVINALSYRRTKHCLLLNHTRRYLLLFLFSAILWWSFEYLNLFVQNWYYAGVTDFGPGRYFVFATLPFATVLPAVLATAEWLNAFPNVSAGLNRFKPVIFPSLKIFSVKLLTIAITGFVVLAIWPTALFFLTWLLPVLLVLGLQSFTEKPSLLLDIETGDWRQLWTLAVAGLICGLFWEMWNFKSLSHWEYTVPYVQQFKIFEMPLLGYAGYLPFGIFCGLFSDFILPAPSQKTVDLIEHPSPPSQKSSK